MVHFDIACPEIKPFNFRLGQTCWASNNYQQRNDFFASSDYFALTDYCTLKLTVLFLWRDFDWDYSYRLFLKEFGTNFLWMEEWPLISF